MKKQKLIIEIRTEEHPNDSRLFCVKTKKMLHFAVDMFLLNKTLNRKGKQEKIQSIFITKE